MKIIEKVSNDTEYKMYELFNLCPSDFGYEDYSDTNCSLDNCEECWNREVKE